MYCSTIGIKVTLYTPVEATCGPHQFHCMVSGRCIDGNLVCNGVSDCRDGTDEQLSSCGE